ncbi:serine hydrolase [Bradyrhizobium sp. 197]|uniref:serine hydrolase domain-containing protein n=1 Tax=Bradyrhizobium sp. 197 TaxID=2782663 RepID=UPI001FF81D49|nr:serine hydrolase [Bradyrhizobium sp. 197]MCK1479629.1 serine hydrolase [Bradyrhizobium sp. 197]
MKYAVVASLGALSMLWPIAVAAQEGEVLPSGDSILWTPEQQVIGFRAIEKIKPVHVVRRGTNVHPLPKAAHQISPRWISRGQAMDVDRYMRERRTSGVIVLRDGEVVLERYGLGRKETDGWISMSVAKSVTSTLIGAAIKDGYIKSLDAPVSDYIHELKASAYEVVSIRQLLTMSSGVKWNEDYVDRNSDVNLHYNAISESGVNPIVSYMRRLPRADEPGTKFVYNTGETDLVGLLLTRAVGKSMAEYLSEKIWRPYGMESDAVWQVDPSGQEYGGCCISATLRDYARIGQFILDGGEAGGVQVLPPGWVQDATSVHMKFAPNAAGKTHNGRRIGYGYFWWIYDNGYAGSGIFGQNIFVYPKDKVVIAINSAWPKPTDSEYSEARDAFAEASRAAAVAER